MTAWVKRSVKPSAKPTLVSPVPGCRDQAAPGAPRRRAVGIVSCWLYGRVPQAAARRALPRLPKTHRAGPASPAATGQAMAGPRAVSRSPPDTATRQQRLLREGPRVPPAAAGQVQRVSQQRAGTLAGTRAYHFPPQAVRRDSLLLVLPGGPHISCSVRHWPAGSSLGVPGKDRPAERDPGPVMARPAPGPSRPHGGVRGEGGRARQVAVTGPGRRGRARGCQYGPARVNQSGRAARGASRQALAAGAAG
jgi:hypothetical protein